MIRAEHVTYRMENRDLLSGISLEFQEGMLYGVLGPNGSGKSTLLKTLAGIWKPSKGVVYWKGAPLHGQSRRQISKVISLVPQGVATPFDFTVEEFVWMGRYPHPESGHANQSLIHWALKTVDAYHLRHRLVNQLSHGERQRIYIGRALVVESPILLLDEPTSSLDIRHQREIWELLRKLKCTGKLIVVSLHDLQICREFCDQAVLLDEGRCVAHGELSECLSPTHLQSVFGI